MAATNRWYVRAVCAGALWAGTLGLALSGAAWARQGVVKTSDGRTIEGDVNEHADGVTVTTRGIDTVIPRDQVATISYGGNVDAELRAKLAALEPKDFDGRFKLARDAFDARKYDVARDAVESALIINPNSREAVDFSQTIRRQMQLEAQKSNAPDKPVAPLAPLTPPSAVERKFLSADDINAIRQVELKAPEDGSIRVRFDNDVRRRFSSATNQDYTAFLALSALDQAQAIFTQADPKLRKDVHVLSDPASIREFKQVVQPVVLRNCATSGCHGGDGAGGFVLYGGADSDAVTYTNFYILQHYSKPSPNKTPSGGIFNATGGQMRMVNRSHPDLSLIIQYALPVAVAEYDHPQVNGWRSSFNTPQDRSAQKIAEWISGSLVSLEPKYDVTYTPPTGKPATQPTTKP